MVALSLILALLAPPASQPTGSGLAEARALTAQGLPLSATARLVEVLVDPAAPTPTLAAALDLFPYSLRGAPAPFAVMQRVDPTSAAARALSTRHRSALAFLIGQSRLAHGATRAAVVDLGRVAPGSPLSPAAQYLRGVAAMRHGRAQLKAAAQLFQAAITEAEAGAQRGVDVVEEARRLSLLGLGRLYFEVGNYAVALYYYRQLPPTAPEAASAEFEAAWAHVMRNEMTRALGAVHGARSPYVGHPARHEMHLVAGAALLGLCQMQRAKVELDRLEQRYLEPLAGLRRTLESFSDGAPRLLVQGGTPLPKAVAALLRDQPEVRVAHAFLARVDAERDRLNALPADGPTVDVAAATARLDALAPIAHARVDRAVRAAGARLIEDQSRLSAQTGELMVDILEDESDRLIREIEAGVDVEVAQPPEAPVATLGGDWQRWSFDGRHWPDELGRYRSTLPSRCVPASKTPEAP